MYKNRSTRLPLAGSLLALGACQGGAEEPVDLSTGQGALIAEAPEGATVCLDENRNYACDADEAQTTVDVDGQYALDALLSTGTPGADAQVIATMADESLTLAAVPGGPGLISGATDLVHHMVTGDNAVSIDDAWATLRSKYELTDGARLAADAHGVDSRLGHLASYLESYKRVASVGKAQPSDVLGALEAADTVRAYLDALERPLNTLSTARRKSVGADGVRKSDNYANMAFTQGMGFATGWNDVQSTVMGNTQCLEDFELTSTKNFTEKFRMLRIKDKSDLTKELDISGKVALDLATFDATIEGEFYDLMKLNENYVYLMAQLEITLRDFTIDSPKMTLDGFGECNEPDAEGRCPDGKLNNKNGEQIGSVREKFARPDPEAFRVKCGDRYIDTITTGGSYLGMLVLKTSSQQEKEKIGATLDAAIKKTIEVDGSLKSLFDELSQKENTEIVIMKRGTGGGSTVVVTPEQFDTDLQTFKTNVCNVHDNGCTAGEGEISGDDWTKAPFRVKYESYAPIAETPQGGDVAADSAAMDVFVNLTDQYTALRNSILNMLAVPVFYDGVFGREPELNDRIEEISTHLAIVRDLYSQCNREIGRTCHDLQQPGAMAAHGLKTVVQLRGANAEREWEPLPSVKMRYPRTCTQYKNIYRMDDLDGNKLLYMNGDQEKMFWMYCDGMDTVTPVDYLTLEQYDAASHNARDNFSQFLGLPGTDGEPTIMTTVYDRLKVLVNADSLKVDINGQDKFRTTLGGPIVEPLTDEVFTDAPYAIGKSCDAVSGIVASINLEGTPFKLGEHVGFEVPDKQMELITDPKIWYHARRDAMARGGRLPVVTREDENDDLLDLLTLHGHAQAWIGLRATWVRPREFVWPDGSSNYLNFANADIDTWLNTFPQSRGDYCGAMRSGDGMWEPAACRTQARPYFVQYRKSQGTGAERTEAETEGNRQAFDLSASSQLGCGSVSTDVQISLEYAPELSDGIPEPTH